ncbi:site-specific integrase [Wenyingzhuangia marina]|uniref:Site-specific recombinase XerD n=1 Tax=Wenyingzhuangia marina TaxID=1195760 RepID=A0A1M5VBQ4_9FLAO|nr:site-specific integrase [Wenyingzhuangia marina]GGF73158.1 transposase [Wenyingzhuangia marina]SHH72635.1 Site-specific recombinase XerD [Wenyingzhuangia marina]
MVSSNTYSLLTWLYTQKVEPGFATIYFRITINSKRANISLNKKVKIDSWDNSKSKFKGNSNEARIINQYLKEEESKIAKAYQELEYEEKLITAQLVKARYLGTDQKHKSLQDLITYHNQFVEKKIHKDTLRSYKTSQKYLWSYINEKLNTSNIYLKELDYQFLLGFETYLRSYQPTNGQLKIQNNTVMKHIQRLRKMIKMAVELEWINKDPFIRFSPTIEKKQREYLTENELNKIQNYHSKIERLRLVKDLFLFSCYTGLSYIDIRNLSPDNIAKGIDGNNWIITKRQKTGISVKVPLLEPAEKLIKSSTENYRKIDFNKIFPTISNQKVNSYLKEIADCCGITKNLTFHMARHTFATTVTLSNGIPIETVSKMLGHTKLTTTQIYAKIIDKKVSEDMSILRNKFSENSHLARKNKVS